MRSAQTSISIAVFAIIFALCLSGSSYSQSRSFKDQDLSKRSFAGQNLNGADFSGATLQDANFSNANLKGADLREADLRNATFYMADLTGADLRNIIGPFHANDANFSNVNLEGVDLKGYLHQKVSFRGANLRNTTGWSCSDCNFRQADLRGANLLGLSQNMQPSLFIGAIYDDETGWPSWMGGAPPAAKRAQ
jgi:uncharacterized protein YjbI with pentapeptide repeats